MLKYFFYKTRVLLSNFLRIDIYALFLTQHGCYYDILYPQKFILLFSLFELTSCEI